MTAAGAAALFVSLDPAPRGMLAGFWRGRAVATGHPVDGMLVAAGWLGKEFLPDGRVHPLVCQGPSGPLNLDPRRLPVRMALAFRPDRLPGASRLFRRLAPLFASDTPRARLDVATDGGSPTAVMVYEDLPITDVFRRIGPDSVMGRMDCPWLRRPAFIRLDRA
jgi:hypothetical protein